MWNVQNPRTFKPSSSFFVATTDAEGYIIDAGGQDIIVQCDEMAPLAFVHVETLNKTNGQQTTAVIQIKSDQALKGGDILNIELPPEVSFGKQVTCKSLTPVQLTCSHSQDLLQVTTQSETTELHFEVSHLVNPRSTQKSAPFPAFFTTDAAGYKALTAPSEIYV